MPSDRDYLLLLLGAALFVVLSHQIPALRTLNEIKLEDMNGIDLQSLSVCRQNRLM